MLLNDAYDWKATVKKIASRRMFVVYCNNCNLNMFYSLSEIATIPLSHGWRFMSPGPNPRHASPLVLVVEDEFLIRMLAVDTLVEAGFAVLEAEHASEALACLRSNTTGIDALFTDVHMPGDMCGVMLAHETRRSWPWIHLLVTSGRLRPAQAELPDLSRFLPKPYMLQQLVDHLREMMAT